MNISKMIEFLARELKLPLVTYNQKGVLANKYRFSCEDSDFVIYSVKENLREIFRSNDEKTACDKFIKIVAGA